MSAEAIARRFEELPGHELLDYADVGLPVFRLLIDAVTMARKSLPPISEFSLRVIDAGLRSQPEASAFLGVDPSIVAGTVNLLEKDRLLTVAESPEGEETYALTDSGREVLREAVQHRPQDQILTVDYDGILRKPIAVDDAVLGSAHHLALRNAIEVHPYPADPPDASQVDLAEVRAILARRSRVREDVSFDLLALKRVTRVIRLFRPAVGLAFRMRATKDVRIIFVVEGARDEELERAFAEKNGPRKMRILQSITESDMQASIRRRLGKTIVDQLPKNEVLTFLRRSYSMARLREEVNRRKSERALALEGRAKAEEAASTAQLEAEKAAAELRALPARQMAPYEPRELLFEFMQMAQKRIWISSNWLHDAVISPAFLRRLNGLLARGVQFLICFYVDQLSLNSNRYGRNAYQQLERISRRNPKLVLEHRKQDSLHFAVMDDRTAVLTNQSFLGNLHKMKNFIHVQGIVLQGAELVGPFCERLEVRAAGAQQ